jgi:transcriptional regulator with XRE-family HTH domain
MASLGQLFKDARERKGSSFEEIEAATGLWPEYVRALESGDYSKFASASHLRSALRLYARYLNLDVREVLALWERTPSGAQPAIRETKAGSPGAWYQTVTIALAALLTVGVCAVAGFYTYGWLLARGSTEAIPEATVPGEAILLPSPTAVPSPAAYLPIDSTSIPRYVITATLDYAGHSLTAEERIDYANRTGEMLSDIVLNVFPNHEPDVFTLDSLSLEFGAGPKPAEHSLEGMTLRVPLPEALEPGEVVTLFLEFTLDLPYIDPQDSFVAGSLGWSERAADVGHWYPGLAPFLPGEGWYTFDYYPVGDPYVVEEAEYDVRIQAPEGVTVAGSGEEQREGNWWHYRITQARSFAFAASDQYVSQKVEGPDVTVISYYFPEHELAGVDVAQVAAEALETYGEEFGVPYPYRYYRVAESEFAGGMEFSAVSFLGSLWYQTYAGGVRSQLISLLVHEVSHQWWYGLVGSDQVREPWLDEALATFSESIFYEVRYPHDDLWLWDFEVLNWPLGGPIDGSIYDYADEASYMNAVYRTGAMFLADLRQAVGTEQFQAFLKDYCQTQSHALSSSADFFTILSRHTDEDLSMLLAEYFARPPGEAAP